MLKIVSYGLTVLAAVVVVASCCVYGDEFYLLGKRSTNLREKARLLSQRSDNQGMASRSVPGGTLHG